MPEPADPQTPPGTDADTPGQPVVTPPESLPPGLRPRNPILMLKDAIEGSGNTVIAQVHEALAATITELANALGTTITEINSTRMCALCSCARAEWDRVNADAIMLAQAKYQEAAGQAAAASQPPPNIIDFLADDIRPHPADKAGDAGHMPMVYQATTQINGTLFCQMHIARDAATRAQPGQAVESPAGETAPNAAQQNQLVVPPSGMALSAAAAVARAVPAGGGMPGAPGR
jgi:hypothetical protein